MTTFVPTYNDGYLALSSKLMLMDEQLFKMAEDTNVVDAIIVYANELALFTGEDQDLKRIIINSGAELSQNEKPEAAFKCYTFALAELEKEKPASAKTKVLIEGIEEQIVREKFNILSTDAREKGNSGNYKESATLYKQAFALDLIRATHMVRVGAVPILAQAGEIEEAFTQLDLLANRFVLGGNDSFINDPLCSPLHNDPRWEKLMKELGKNAEKYK